MTSVVELFPKSRKLAYDARQQLTLLHNGSSDAHSLFLTIEELNRQLDIMDKMVMREPPQQREMWRYKISELRADAESIRKQGQQSNGTQMRLQREREALLARRRRRQQDGGEDNNLENLADEGNSLQNSMSMMNDLLMSGQSTLTSLVEQRGRLKGVKRTVLDIGNKLGLSRSTMRMIEKRDATDFYIVIGGMIFTLLVLYMCYF